MAKNPFLKKSQPWVWAFVTGYNAGIEHHGKNILRRSRAFFFGKYKRRALQDAHSLGVTMGHRDSPYDSDQLLLALQSLDKRRK